MPLSISPLSFALLAASFVFCALFAQIQMSSIETKLRNEDETDSNGEDGDPPPDYDYEENHHEENGPNGDEPDPPNGRMPNDENDEEFDDEGALADGRRVCERAGLQYQIVRRCLLSPTCGDAARFKCIRGHCCELSNPQQQKDQEDAEDGRDEDGRDENGRDDYGRDEDEDGRDDYGRDKDEEGRDEDEKDDYGRDEDEDGRDDYGRDEDGRGENGRDDFGRDKGGRDDFERDEDEDGRGENGRDEDEDGRGENGRKEDEDGRGENGRDEDEDVSDQIGGDEDGTVPVGPAGFCVGTGEFRKFMGHTCRTRKDCPMVLNTKGRQIPVRCLRSACCAAIEGGNGRNGQKGRRASGRKHGRMKDDEEEEDGKEEEERRQKGRRWKNGEDEGEEEEEEESREGGSNGRRRLIPKRPTGTEAFCFDGSKANRQCFTNLDCNNSSALLICTNLLCCPPARDAQQYACGGLQPTSQCSVSSSDIPPAGLCPANGLHCVSPGACCECAYGQPQPGVSRCQTQQNSCKDGYRCDQQTGFCCPHCADGEIPFGSCHLGRCAPSFVCRPGNICCSATSNTPGGISRRKNVQANSPY